MSEIVNVEQDLGPTYVVLQNAVVKVRTSNYNAVTRSFICMLGRQRCSDILQVACKVSQDV